MNPRPSLALIINTFDQPDYLARVLTAVSRQPEPPGEVLLADDGSGEETRRVFADWSGRQRLRTRHLWQKNEGFRRARILNLAIAAATSEYVVFLDGDTLPHPQMVADHRALAQPGVFVQGHRALVEQSAAAWFGLGELSADRRRALWRGQLRGLKNAWRWPLPWSGYPTHWRGIRGCNLAVWREDLLRVNGYNEDFTGWGREDSELAVRLMNSGLRRRDLRGRALCYHLWHPPASRARLADNDSRLAQAIQQAQSRCEHGVDQHL
jgi:glycosyltransferase involved in cell wall biosynthesis